MLCTPERRQSTRAEAGEESLINGGAARMATISSSSSCATSERLLANHRKERVSAITIIRQRSRCQCGMLVAYVCDGDWTRIACMPMAGRHATHRSVKISSCSEPPPKSSTAPLKPEEKKIAECRVKVSKPTHLEL